MRPLPRAISLAGSLTASVLAIAAYGPGCNPSGSSSPNRSNGTGLVPRVSALDPAHRAPGEVLTITGADFETDRNLDTVMFGGVAASVLSVTSAEIVCRVPNVAAGATRVNVTTRSGASVPAAFTVDAAPAGAPSISGLSAPAAAAGDAVVVTGQGFDPSPAGNTVTLFGDPCPVTAASPTRLDIVVPQYAFAGALQVRTARGASNAVTLMVTDHASQFPMQPGAQAGDFLKDSPSQSLLVEIDYIQGKAPSSAAIDMLMTRLTERCRKPLGITYILSDAIPTQNLGFWFRQDLINAEVAHRNHYSAINTAVLYVLYVDSASEFDAGNRVVVGYTYSGTGIAMFKDNLLLQAHGDANQAALVEQPAVAHECGHIYGLVNGMTPMQTPHEDPAARLHDVSSGCLMFHSTNQQGATQFCSSCLADLQAVGGR